MDDFHSQIVTLREGTSRTSVFCIHDGNFELLAPHLPLHICVYGLRWLNLGGVDPKLTIEMLAESHLRQVSTVESEGPYYLLGYSFGGLVAYEMARQLRDGGKQVGVLALFDTPHPRFHENLSTEKLNSARNIYLKDRKRKYLSNLRRGRVDHIATDMARFARQKSIPLVGKIIGRTFRALGLQPPNLSQAAGINRMWHTYSPRTFDGRLVQFRAEGRSAEFGDDATMGWCNSASSVDVQFSHGPHESMMDILHVERLARQLSPYLSAEHGP